jgi:hypothetical protein
VSGDEWQPAGRGQVVLGSPGNPSVVFRDAREGDDGWFYFAVELHGAGLDVLAGAGVHPVTQSFTAFVRDLQRDWKGWDDERRWASTEPGLAVAATHTGRSVRLRWTASLGTPPEWTATLETSVAPGEEFSAFVRDVSDALQPAR